MVLSVELYNLRVPAAKNFLLDSLHINRVQDHFQASYVIASKRLLLLLLTESKETQLCKFRSKRCRGNACWIHMLNCALIQNSPLPLLHYFGSATDSTVRWTDSVSLILDVRASNFQYTIHWPFYLCIYAFIYLFIVMKWSSKYSFSAKEMQTTKVENVGCGMN